MKVSLVLPFGQIYNSLRNQGRQGYPLVDGQGFGSFDNIVRQRYRDVLRHKLQLLPIEHILRNTLFTHYYILLCWLPLPLRSAFEGWEGDIRQRGVTG